MSEESKAITAMTDLLDLLHKHSYKVKGQDTYIVELSGKELADLKECSESGKRIAKRLR